MYSKESFLKALQDTVKNILIQPEHPYATLIYDPLEMLRSSIEADTNHMFQIIALDPTTDPAEVDKIASNYLVKRSVGRPSEGRITVAVLNKVTFVPSELVAMSTSGMQFSFTRTIPVKPEDYRRGPGYYYIDLEVIAAEAGVAGNVPAGAINQIAKFPGTYLFVKNSNQTYNGADTQSNEDVIEAIRNSVTDYSLTRKPGCARMLLQDFDPVTGGVSGTYFEWFKIAGTGDPLMKRDIRIINGIEEHIMSMADVWGYPYGGLIDGSENLPNIGSESPIAAKPALGPFYIEDSLGRIPDIYWKIILQNYAVDNSLQENKRITYREIYNRFTTKTPESSRFKTYGVVRGHTFLAGSSESGVVNVSNDEHDIFIDEEYSQGASADARTYEILYEGKSPFITYDKTTNKNVLYDTSGVDFNSVVDPILVPAPYLEFYQVVLVDSENKYYFFDISAISSTGDYLTFEGEFIGSCKEYKIVKSNIMYKAMTIDVIEFMSIDGGPITEYNYFKAEYVAPETGSTKLAEDIIMPLVARVNSEGLYMEYNGKYYRIAGIELSGKTLFIQLKYALPATPVPPNPATMNAQEIFSLKSSGSFSSLSSISDVVSGAAKLYFRTYDISKLQQALDQDDYRIISSDYLARLPYEVEVKVNVRYKGTATVQEVLDMILEYVNNISPKDDPSGGFLQASDIIDLLYNSGEVDYVDLSTFSVVLVAYLPTSTREWCDIDRVEYELYGQDIKRNIVFKYHSTTDDVTVASIP